jgi:hypothetical protein
MKPKVRYEVRVSDIVCEYAGKPTVSIKAMTFYFTHAGILLLTYRKGDEGMSHRARRVMHDKVHKGVFNQLLMRDLVPFKFVRYRLESVMPISSVGRLT